jgi:hypothetical protein
MSRIPLCLDNRLKDGVEVLSHNSHGFIKKKFRQSGWCPAPDSNPAPPQYMSIPFWSQSYFTTDSQYVLVSSPLCALYPDITSCRNVAVWNLASCFCGAPSLTRGRVCNLQCNHSMVRAAQNPAVATETPPPQPSVRLDLMEIDCED